jgi:hypothetical protein
VQVVVRFGEDKAQRAPLDPECGSEAALPILSQWRDGSRPLKFVIHACSPPFAP